MSADRNLLVGIIALQNNLIDRHQLVSAFDRWTTDKQHELADILQQIGAIGKAERELLDALAKIHIAKHGGDPQASLAAVSSVDNIAAILQPVHDNDLHASLRRLPARRPNKPAVFDPLATQLPETPQSLSASRFRILRPYASGGLGEVFVANDDELHRTVALKQIKDSHADEPESRTRFMVEAEITGALEHPGIVPVYGLGHYADGRPYYAMRFIRGDSLTESIAEYHRCRKSKLPGGDLLALRGLLGRLIDVCEAIEYAHCRGILHRDLKPGNIMVGRFGETLVVDWGLARLMQSTEPEHSLDEGVVRPVSITGVEPTLMGAAVGTPQYMSPEQAMGRLDLLGPRSDVYSLGATLFCLLSGEAPVAGDTQAAVMQRVQRGELKDLAQLNSSLDKGIIAICYKSLAQQPNDRYARAADLADDLQRWLADEPVSALPESWLAKAGRWARRHRSLVATISLATCILVAILAISLWTVSAAHQRERLAHSRAESSFRAARDAVDQYFTRVSESTLLNQPGLQTLRRDLLQSALQYYTAFLKDHQDDQQLQTDMALARFNAGRIHEELGELELAQQEYQQALTEQETLSSKSADDEALQETLSDMLIAQGRLLQRFQKLPDSLKSYQRALELRQKLSQAEPDNMSIQRKTANAHMNIGVLSMIEGDLKGAEEAIQTAQKLRVPWLKSPDNILLRRDLAKGYYNLGLLCVQRNQASQARDHFLQAAQIFEELVSQHPEELDQRLLLATCYRLAGDAVAAKDDTSEAIDRYGKSLKIVESLAARNPEVTEYQTTLAGVLLNMSSVDNNETTSLQSLNRAIEVLRNQTRQTASMATRHDLATALQRRSELTRESNRHASTTDQSDAIKILQDLVKEFPHASELAEELEAAQKRGID